MAHNSIDVRKKYEFYYKGPHGGEFNYKIDNKTLYIYCVATNEQKDWFINFYGFSVDTDIGRFHKGYYLVAVDFMTELSKKVNYAKIEHVIIDGYSYGGGEAKVLTCLFGKVIDKLQNKPSKKYALKSCSAVAMEGLNTINKRANEILLSYSHTKLYTIRNSNDAVTKGYYNFVPGGEVIDVGRKRVWYSIDFVCWPKYYNKTRDGLYKFFTILSHEYSDFKTNLMTYINTL